MHLTLSQLRPRPDVYGASARLLTMPSSPSPQALREERAARRRDVIAEADRARASAPSAAQRLAQQLLALEQRQPAQVVAVEVQQIERVVDAGRVAALR